MRESEKNNRLEDLLDMKRLQSLQDTLAQALGLAFVTVDYQGRPVSQSSGFTDFCSCMQKHEKYGRLCSQCYAHGGLHATMAESPYIYRCHCGLVEFAVPLLAEGKYLGAIMGGQCELMAENSALEPVLPQRTPWEVMPEPARTRTSVHKTTYEKLEAGIRLVQEMTRNLLEEARSRTTREELQQKSLELMEEKTTRVNLELALQEEEESGVIEERLDSEHLFYVLNLISRLAFLEKAEETERTACDFASMMRYVLESGEDRCVTLGEELEYIGYYLQIQKRRMEGKLYYEISVPEKYQGCLCPFMLLHPLAKKVVKYVLDHSREGGSLSVCGREEKDLLLLTISCECTGHGGHPSSRVLNLEGKRQGMSLNRIDQSIKNVFGRDCGVMAKDREDGLTGMEIQVRLPLQSGFMER